MKYQIGDKVIIKADHPNERCNSLCQYNNSYSVAYRNQEFIITTYGNNGRGHHYHGKPIIINDPDQYYDFHISDCMLTSCKESGVRLKVSKIRKDFTIPQRTTPLKILYKQFKLGVELETVVPYDAQEQITQTLRTNKIAFTYSGDGSITSGGEGSGVEFKSAKPMDYTLLKHDLKQLTDEFAKHEVFVNTSCGFHLHISNKRFFTASNMDRIIIAWSALEDVFLATQPKSRTNNSYCQRYLKQFIKDQKNDFKLLRGKEKLRNQLSSSNGRERYFTLNLQALRKHGTIEIRLHAGTTNYTKVMAWVDLMLAFFTYCLTDYKHKEVFGLFYQPISDLKVNNVLTLLDMSDKRKIYFKNRVNKFLFTYLSKQQEVAGRIMQNMTAVKKARKAYVESEKKYKVLNTAFEAEYNTLLT